VSDLEDDSVKISILKQEELGPIPGPLGYQTLPKPSQVLCHCVSVSQRSSDTFLLLLLLSPFLDSEL
jgi:hypothetical protein